MKKVFNSSIGPITYQVACRLKDYYNQTGLTDEFEWEELKQIFQYFNLNMTHEPAEVDPAGGWGANSHI